jgi:hypothetical protein
VAVMWLSRVSPERCTSVEAPVKQASDRLKYRTPRYLRHAFAPRNNLPSRNTHPQHLAVHCALDVQ